MPQDAENAHAAVGAETPLVQRGPSILVHIHKQSIDRERHTNSRLALQGYCMATNPEYLAHWIGSNGRVYKSTPTILAL
ncbi:hypothetical protein PHBOTO_005229 [Pseudozyma hubeiensis]|nr:hypothetical protein PHBOTO_005229 [Pseudozyma hubeiensis]